MSQYTEVRKRLADLRKRAKPTELFKAKAEELRKRLQAKEQSDERESVGADQSGGSSDGRDPAARVPEAGGS